MNCDYCEEPIAFFVWVGSTYGEEKHTCRKHLIDTLSDHNQAQIQVYFDRKEEPDESTLD